MAEPFFSVSRILSPTLSKLLCNMQLMALFHISMFNCYVINSFHLERIFITAVLDNCIGTCPSHICRAFLDALHKKIHLIRSVTVCYIYFPHIHLMLLTFLFGYSLWIWNIWWLNNICSFLVNWTSWVEQLPVFFLWMTRKWRILVTILQFPLFANVIFHYLNMTSWPRSHKINMYPIWLGLFVFC